MQRFQPVDRPNAPPAPGGFSPVAFFLALAIGPVVGMIWACAGDAAQFYVSPFLLFPILVGVFAGLTIVGLARFAQVGHRPTILLAAVSAAAVAACGQHYLAYLSTYSQAVPLSPLTRMTQDVAPELNERARREAIANSVRAIQREVTPSFGEYLLAQAKRGRPLPGGHVAAGWAAWLTWVIDVILTLAAALAVTIPAVRIPYCNRCGSWYRTIRNGRIDVHSAQRLAEICKVDEISDFHSPRYRLSCCLGGCGPTRCELSWEESGGAVDLVRVWLDGEQRKRVGEVLDELGSADEG